MNYKKFMKSLMLAVLALGVLALAAGTSLGADVTVNLKAEARSVTLPDGLGGSAAVPMWGFFDTSDIGTEWAPGPTLRLNEGDNLTITLSNSLTEAVSIVIPGQATALAPVRFTDAEGRSRVSSFTAEAGTFNWTNLKAGTYLYHSGSHPALQVPMGLYGALIVDPAIAGTAYTPTATNPDTGYTAEVVLLYSEIDVELHNPPGVAQPMNYIPEYYLINGKPYAVGDAPFLAGNVNDNVLIRFLNAGLKTHVPTLLNAPYMSVIAEDGNLYPYAKHQYSVLLAAGKTMDTIWRPTAEDTFALVDSTNTLTTAGETGGGMLTYLQVGVVAGGPVAANDSATVAEGATVAVLDSSATTVLANDTGTGLEAVLASGVSNGLLVFNPDGTFSYTHNGGQTTTDSFTYRVRDTGSLLESNVATVSITVLPVNDAPVANPDNYSAVAGVGLNVAAPGVLGNDNDPDGNPLTAVLATNVTGGTLTLNADGSFAYMPNAGTVSDSFTYVANDGIANSATAATVTISVSAPVNTAPVAMDDYATTTRNTVVFINLIANDTDAESNLKDAFGDVAASRISIVTQPTRGGTVTVLTNGVNFTPKNNFRGTDVFTYTVTDIEGLPSNTATVRVNVTR